MICKEEEEQDGMDRGGGNGLHEISREEKGKNGKGEGKAEKKRR